MLHDVQIVFLFTSPSLLKSLEKAMAPRSSTLAWKIPWTEEPCRLQSMGSRRVWHDWVTSLSFFTFMHWRRKWQPTPMFLPGESQGRGSLVGCRLWGHTESDTTERLSSNSSSTQSGPQTSSIHQLGDARNAETQDSLQIYGIRICILTSSSGNVLYTNLWLLFVV